MNDRLQKTQETWDAIDINKVRDVSWLAIRYFSLRIDERLTKNHRQPLDYLFRRRYPIEDLKHLKGLVLVCGDMASERGYFESLPQIVFEMVDGYDLSPESIQRFHTEKFKFNPHILDVNDIILPSEQFDLVVGNHGIHHIYNLGGLFYQTHKSLKPNGLFVLNEWIGPCYLQIPLRNHFLAALLLIILFPFRETRKNHEGRVKGLWVQYPPTAFDPSEACNSDELMPQLLKYFKPIRLIAYGGLSYPIYEGLGHKIDETRWRNKARIIIVYYLELILTKLRIIRPLFVFAIVEKRQDICRQYNWQNIIINWLKKYTEKS